VAATLSRGLTEIEKRVQHYLLLRHETTEALEVLETCLRCSAAPSREVCYACENLTRRERIPAYIRALVN
jgi:recombinational DNA repair protein RecR